MPNTGSFPLLISKKIRVTVHTIDTTPTGPENTITSIDVYNDRDVLLGQVRPAAEPYRWFGTTAATFREPAVTSPEFTGYGDAVRWVDVMAHRYDRSGQEQAPRPSPDRC